MNRSDEAPGPDIPRPLRQELLKELAEARLGADPTRIEDAEVALGERHEDRRVRLAAAMRALLRHRRPDATICPSDAARIAGGESWRDLMDPAREVAAELARAGVVVVRQHGADIDLATAVGPVRLARGPAWTQP